MSDTIAAIATGNTASAIGIIRLTGDGAIGIVSGIFISSSEKRIEQYPDRTLILGEIKDKDGHIR